MAFSTALVCNRCKASLSEQPDYLFCASCSLQFPRSDGIADFSGGVYYDNFPGPGVLSKENLRGLENESEGARIEDFYLPLLNRSARGSGMSREKPRVLDSGCGNGESVDVLIRHDNQVSSHWYGRVFPAPMAALFRLMLLPGFRFLASTPVNPYLVLEVSRLAQTFRRE
jgi:hypothetical protein